MFVIAVLAPLGATSSGAECIYPRPPEVTPDGAKATYHEMATAHGSVQTFDAHVSAYVVCLKREFKGILDDSTIDEATKNDLRELLVRRTDAAVDQAEFVVDQFNQQLRVFRARDDK